MSKKLNKKKRAFTLIELIAVIAIIGILAAVLVPRVARYINEAKKTKVVAQARNVVMGVDSANAKDIGAPIGDSATLSTITGATEGTALLAQQFIAEGSSIANETNKLKDTLTIGQLRDIAGNKVTFTIGADGVIGDITTY